MKVRQALASNLHHLAQLRRDFEAGVEMKPLTWMMAFAVALVTICFAVLSAQA